MNKICMFSGGKDSTAMLFKCIEQGIVFDEIIFADTTKEFNEMYEHISKVEKMINQPIVKLVIPFDYWAFEHIKIKGKNKGCMGYGWCGGICNWCTALKRDTIKKYLKGKDVIEYQGIALDEPNRLLKNKGRNIVYPLVDYNMTEQDCLEYCYSLGLSWGGLYESLHRVSCFCCTNKRVGELRYMYNNRPQEWGKLLEMQSKINKPFKRGLSVIEWEQRFRDEK